MQFCSKEVVIKPKGFFSVSVLISGLKNKSTKEVDEQKVGKALVATLQKQGGTEDSTLTRATGDAAQEKYRCTFEARHIIMKYLDPAAEAPTAANWQGALVVKGSVHARLDNITEQGVWKRDEEYVFAGQRISRKAGKSAGRVLKSYVELRKEHPEWFENLEVYSQPSAVVDAVIMKWMLEEQSRHFGCSIWCRDMLAAGQSGQTRLVQSLAQQLPSRVYGGVTCLIQLTDTDYSWSFKSSVAAAQMQERAEQKLAAKALGVTPEFKCSHREIVKIIWSAQKAQEQRELERPWILAAARRNGYLHYRPDFLQNKLVESSLQEWAQELPEGSYRYPSSWLEERSSWLINGMPMKADLKAFLFVCSVCNLFVEMLIEDGYN